MKFLCAFAHCLHTFRIPELQSVCDMFGYPLSYDPVAAALMEISDMDDLRQTPFLFIELPSVEAAQRVASRAVLVRAMYDVWGMGKTCAEAKEQLMHVPEDILENTSWRIEIEGFGRSYAREEQLEVMHRFKGVPFFEKGKVAMKNCHRIFVIIEDVGVQKEKSDPARMVYVGVLVSEGGRALIKKFNLQHRPFLGTTTMDPELSLVSANMAQARACTLILDPFVGTGSMILTCAYFGAMVMGADIDIRTLRNPDVNKRVETNFEYMKIAQNFVGLYLGDNSRAPLRATPILDAIVCDPPYGIRAGARKVGKKVKPKYKPVPENFEREHFPQCIGYKVSDVMADLLSLAARMLTVNGRLVFWLPTTPEYNESDLPRHPCLQLVANSEQPMTRLWGRRLITMQKIIPYDPTIHDNLEAAEYGQTTQTHNGIRQAVFYKPPRYDKNKGGGPNNITTTTNTDADVDADADDDDGDDSGVNNTYNKENVITTLEGKVEKK